MDAASDIFYDWEFEERLAQIALPASAVRMDRGQAAPGIVSLTLFAVGVSIGLLFFVVGVVLLFFCIGIFVWYFGAAIVAAITGAGAVAGIVAIAVNPRRPAEQMTGILGFLLNSAACAACVTFLTMFRSWWM